MPDWIRSSARGFQWEDVVQTMRVRIRVGMGALLLPVLAAYAVVALPASSASAPPSAAAASASAAYVPRLKPYADDVLAGLSVIAALGLATAVLLSLWLAVKEWWREPLIIEPFDAPKDLQDLGLTGSVLSQQLHDAILELQRNARPDDGPADIAFVELPRLQVDLQLPGMAWSIRGVIRYMKQALGRSERRLMGEVVKRGRVYDMRLRSASGRAIDIANGFHGASDLPMTLALAAEAAVMLTDSLEGASILYAQETPRTRYKKTLAALRFHLSSAPESTHQDAYVLWASVCRALGDFAGMESRLALARSIDGSRWTGVGAAQLGTRYLNFVGSLARARGQLDEARAAFGRARSIDRHNLGALSNLGLAALDTDDFASAQRWFQALIKVRPTSSRGYRGLGLLAARKGDWQTSVRWLSRAVDLAPRARWPRVNRIDALRALGRFDAAESEADAFISEDPDFSPLYRFRSAIAQDRGDFLGARAWARRAVETDPTDPWTFVFLARAANRLGEQDAALEAVQRAMALRSDMPEAIRCRAAVLSAEGRLDAAIEALTDGAAANPQDIWCLLELSDLHRARGCMDDALAAASAALKRRRGNAHALRRMAWVFRDRGDMRGAESRLRQAVAAWPFDTGAMRDLADILLRQRRYDEAVDAARAMLAGGVRPEAALVQVALIQASCLRTAEAEATLRESIAAGPDSVTPWIKLAEFLRQQERLAEARDIAAARASAQPANSQLLRCWASVLIDLGDVAGASHRMVEALAAAPADVDALLEVASLKLRIGALDDALSHATRATQVRRDAVHAWRVKADVLTSLGDIAGAEAALNSAIDWAPGDVWCRANLCRLLRNAKRYDAAAAAALALSRWRPDSPQGRIEAGWTALARGHAEAAQTCFIEAAGAAPAHDVQPRLRYASFLQSQDRFDQAIAQVDHVLEADGRVTEALALKFAILSESGRWQDAAEAAEHWASMARGEIEPFLKLAGLHWTERPEDARRVLARALSRRPTSLRVRRELLQLAIEQGAWIEAERWFNELRGLAPLEVRDLLVWARAWESRDVIPVPRGTVSAPLRQALSAVAQALQLRPGSAEAWRTAANLHERCGDSAAAEDAWRSTLRIDPRDTRAARSLARQLGSDGRRAEATVVLRSALRYKPQSVGLLDQLARILRADGHQRAALREAVLAQRAVLPASPWDHLVLAHLMEHLGARDRAASMAQRAADLAPSNAEVLEQAAFLLRRIGQTVQADRLSAAAAELAP